MDLIITIIKIILIMVIIMTIITIIIIIMKYKFKRRPPSLEVVGITLSGFYGGLLKNM